MKRRNGRLRIALLVAQLDDGYVTGIVNGIIAQAHDMNADLFIISARNPVDNGRDFQSNVSGGFITRDSFDGCIVMTAEMSDYLDEAAIERYLHKLAPLPKVCIGSTIPGYPRVSVQGGSGIGEAVQHLVKIHGMRQIAFVQGPEGNKEAEERFIAYREALQSLGLAYDANLVVRGDFTNKGGMLAAAEFLKRFKTPPKAIITCDDTTAIGLSETFSLAGFEAARDYALIGYDDAPEALLPAVPLTTVRQPLREMGTAAVTLLLDLIAGKKVPPESVLDTQLLLRASCGCGYDPLDELLRPSNARNYHLLPGFDPKTSANQKSDCMGLAVRAFERDALRSRESLWALFHALGDISTSYDVQNIFDNLNTHMGELGIEDCWIALYDTSEVLDETLIPAKSRLAYSLEGGMTRSIPSGSHSFPTTRILPESAYKETGCTLHYLLPLFYRQEQYGYILIGSETSTLFAMETIRLLVSTALKENLLLQERDQALSELRSSFDELEGVNHRLKYLSHVDELTRLHNRRGFFEIARDRLAMAKRSMSEMTLFFLDMDGLKTINDTFGHEEGDNALKDAAEILKKTFRGADVLARIGGDEFAVLAMSASTDSSTKLIQRLRQVCADFSAKGTRKYPISLSVGTAAFNGKRGQKLENLLAEADEALYRDKRARKEKKSS